MQDGWTPLMFNAEMGTADATAILLGNKARLEARNEARNTRTMHICFRRGVLIGSWALLLKDSVRRANRDRAPNLLVVAGWEDTAHHCS